MSISDRRFTRLIAVVNEVLKDGAAAQSRARKNDRIQGFSLDQENIFKEISHRSSPFMLPGQEATPAERTQLAKRIADDLWNIYTTKIRLGKVFTVGQEALFVQSPVPSVLFDAGKRLMLIKGKEGSKHFTVLQAANTKVVKFLNSRPASDPTRTFFNKNPEYVKLYNELNEKLKAEWLQQPEAATASDKQKNKWLENQRKRQKIWKDFNAGFTQNTGGAVAGHVFGGPVTIAAGLFENEDDIFNKDLKDIQITSNLPSELRPTIKQLVIDVINADAKVDYKRSLGKNSVLGLITITVPELDVKNATEGSLVKEKFKKLKAYLIQHRLDIYKMQGSPSYSKLITDLIENKFLGKRTAPRTFKTSRKVKNKRQAIPIQINNVKGSRVKTRPTTKNKSQNRGSTSNLQNLINMLNNRLHDQIRENMGKGGSKQKLNYRTGRFARSARIENLLTGVSRSSITAEMKYMRNPYGVFEKGGRLHKTLRDPKGIFGRSIRQILQEQKIANLTRVKVVFRG